MAQLPKSVLPVDHTINDMPMFMCRWPNGDLSFVSAPTKEDAIIMLDEWDNAELAELSRIRDFMVDFRLNDDGELELQALGETLLDEIWKKAYPIVSRARIEAPVDSVGELTTGGKTMVRKAVRDEKERLKGTRKGKRADTELGKSLQDQMGASAALINRHVKQVATELLKTSPVSGRKQ